MSITAIQPTGTPATGSTTADSTMQAMGPDAFLRLLVAQLQNQDPLNPTDGTQFVMQLSQLTTLQQTQSMTTSLNSFATLGRMGSAASLIGRQAYFTGTDGQIANGLVEEVTVSGNDVLLTAGGQTVPFGNLLSVSTPPVATPTAPTPTVAQP